MTKSRLEAFSDGVIAIIITIMVLQMDAPHSPEWDVLLPLLPKFLSYVLSFVFVGIYWSNHHHMLQASRKVNGAILWANLHLLFWMSLIPFVTDWMGENHFAEAPVAGYGIVLLFSAIAYYLLAQTLIKHHGEKSLIANALGTDLKGKLSILIYVVAILLALVKPWAACSLYVLVAVMWLIPDRRIEKVMPESAKTE
jgi:uncharacterized membrane protein